MAQPQCISQDLAAIFIELCVSWAVPAVEAGAWKRRRPSKEGGCHPMASWPHCPVPSERETVDRAPATCTAAQRYPQGPRSTGTAADAAAAGTNSLPLIICDILSLSYFLRFCQIKEARSSLLMQELIDKT
nr:unnamed protein product [Callosobruchus analis]